MEQTSEKEAAKVGQREALRRQLLKLIVKNEAQRQSGRKASDK